MTYDAILIVSFGGPERTEDVMPFLENVLRGKNVPRERMMLVAEHYYHFGGKSPINDQNRALIAALKSELHQHGPDLPIYWGNRNWHPMLADTLQQMKSDGIRRALAFVTAAYSSYSSCRQYRENIAAAQQAAGEGTPAVDKIRAFHNHPGFVEANIAQVQAALERLPASRRASAKIAYTAHSIPLSMAQSCRYQQQLEEVARLVSSALGRAPDPLVFQSRSGPASQPWLGPDILDHIRELKHQGATDLVIAPIGFVSDHMEVLYDLDTEAANLCHALGINMVRAATAGTHPRFVQMVRELILERMGDDLARPTVGTFPASPDICLADCCPAPARPPVSAMHRDAAPPQAGS
jgi:protoporphyrin/coproporphyrin ferrochelatase